MSMELVLDRHAEVLRKKQEEAASKIAFLEKDGRQDEADLYKAKRNLYAYFMGTLENSRKESGNVLAAYRGRLSHLASIWEKALEKADRHGEYYRQAVEEMKLQALREAMRLLKEQLEQEGIAP